MVAPHEKTQVARPHRVPLFQGITPILLCETIVSRSSASNIFIMMGSTFGLIQVFLDSSMYILT